ncbi:MAG: 2-amino-4-hydroxy-6-hydroxymethyldihydropteridine diphosphokinase [Planctomycetota bacterium]
MTPCLIALGANLNDRLASLTAAAAAVDALPRTRVLETSNFVPSHPVGGDCAADGEFLNGVALVDTKLSPHQLMSELHAIEGQLGRQRELWQSRWGSRPIDLDLLLYADEVIDQPLLRVPHPRMTFRPFVMEHAVKLAPTLRHPELDATLAEIERQRTRGVDGVRVAGTPAARAAVAEALVGRSERFSLDPVSSSHDCRVTLDWDPNHLTAPGEGPKLQILADTAAPLLPATPTLWLCDAEADEWHEELFATIECLWPGL